MAPKRKQSIQSTKQKGKAVKVGKDSAKRATTKGKKSPSSSSTQEQAVLPLVGRPLPHAQKFLNDQAQECFQRIGLNKKLSQRSFPTDPSHPVHNQMVARQWTSLAVTPCKANLTMAAELYANAKFCPEGCYRIRGVDVQITAEAIRQFYHLPVPEMCRYTTYLANPTSIDYDGVVSLITAGKRGCWMGKLQVHELTKEAKFWHHFVCTVAIPTSNTSYITDIRALLVSCILQGEPVDLAAIIFDHFRRSTLAETPLLYFPNLITDLCSNVGVPQFDTDWVVEPKHALFIDALKEEDTEEAVGGNLGRERAEHHCGNGQSSPATKRQVEDLADRLTSIEEMVREMKSTIDDSLRQMKTDMACILRRLTASP